MAAAPGELSAGVPRVESIMARGRSPSPEPMAAILMAAGRGTRMLAKSLPKVCFPILGVPAINRSIRTCRRCGIETIVVVVGADGDQVMQTVSSEHEGVLYAHQPEPHGTGHAVRVGFLPLERIGFRGLIWCLVGDKLIDPAALESVLAPLDDPDLDAAFAVSDRPEARDMGRVLQHPDGRVRAIFEEADLAAGALLGELADDLRRGRVPASTSLRERCLAAVGSSSRCERLLGRAWRLAQAAGPLTPARLRRALPKAAGLFRVGQERLPARDILAAAPCRNESLYCFRSSALARGLRLMPPPRAAREDYFTDIIAALLHPPRGRPARVRAVLIRDRRLIMGFNTPEQLLAIEDALRRREPSAVQVPPRALRLGRDACKPAGEWVRILQADPARLRRALAQVYGDDAAVLDARRRAFLRVATLFARKYGADRPTLLVRAPGGINLMGRHIDEFGGHVNVMSIDREVLFMAAPRPDDAVCLTRAGPPASARFSVTREIGALGWDDWLDYISSAKVRQMISAARTDWSSPVRAAVLRLQQRFRSRRLHGMDAVVDVDIPLAAGIGASDAFMVAASEAYVLLNDIALSPEQMVTLCGEGQRFLGGNAAPARHASAMLGRRGQVMRMHFDPFQVEALVPWPDGLRLALARVAPPGRAAGPPDHRRRLFAAMEIGVRFVKDRFPQHSNLVDRLSDISPQRLGTAPSAIYQLLLQVPLHVTRQAVRHLLSKDSRDHLDPLFATHEPPETYPVREALLFGVAECRRAELFAQRLAEGDLSAIGGYMRSSHEAERVQPPRAAEADAPTPRSAADAALRDLIHDLASEDPRRVQRAQLEYQAGRYGSSTPEIDAAVDAAVRVPGVIGAQLSGSGLGGCIMVLLRVGSERTLAGALRRAVRGARTQVLTPVAGSGLIRV